jgi:protein-L-isoaspartate(D-aspartate) O-methyltransferase
MKTLTDQLIKNGFLKTNSIIEAFRHIDRADFVPPHLKDQAYQNYPLPLGDGQTISQPLTVAFMLELLQPKYGHKVMDVGSGSGWQTALLAYIVSTPPKPTDKPPGQVHALEIIPEIYKKSLDNLRPYHFINDGIIHMYNRSAIQGLPEAAPFNRIIAAAEATRIPNAWQDQLKNRGRLVLPIHNGISLLIKKDATTWEQEHYPGFSFVPFVKGSSH